MYQKWYTQVTVRKRKNFGSGFADFLGEEGLLEDAQAVAIKRVIARQLDQLMKQQAISKVELARRMNTSRAAHQALKVVFEGRFPVIWLFLLSSVLQSSTLRMAPATAGEPCSSSRSITPWWSESGRF